MVNKIIEKLKEELQNLDYVYAFWLEGSYAMGYADAFSDLDCCISVADNKVTPALEHVENVLNQFGELDQCETRKNKNEKMGQKVYHISGTPAYLLIDFNWQMHSISEEYRTYIYEDMVEGAKIIFDKASVVKFVEADSKEIQRNRLDGCKECDYYWGQQARVQKYIQRNLFLEAYAYFGRYVVEPLVKMLRLKYTPLYPDNYLLHISNHIPKECVHRLEDIIQYTNMEEMQYSLQKARKWYSELRLEIMEACDDILQ